MAHELRRARTAADVATARTLFKEYAAWLGNDHHIDLAFQGFAEEFAGLPGKYAPPEGELILAVDAKGKPAGCVAVRPFRDRTCEIKRLYVRPTARGAGLGHSLAAAIVDAARELGYTRAILDTVSFMGAAVRVYESLGFRDIPAYYDNPYANSEGNWTVRFLGADL